MAEPLPLDLSHPLWGRDLRHAALAIVSRMDEASIKQVLEALHARGFTITGRHANKVLADAMGHEVKRGRLRRIGWGRYTVGHLANTTRWRIRRRWDLARSTAPEPAHQPASPPRKTTSAARAMPHDTWPDELPADWWRSWV